MRHPMGGFERESLVVSKARVLTVRIVQSSSDKERADRRKDWVRRAVVLGGIAL